MDVHKKLSIERPLNVQLCLHIYGHLLNVLWMYKIDVHKTLSIGCSLYVQLCSHVYGHLVNVHWMYKKEY